MVLKFVRYGLPAIIAAAGALLLAVGSDAAQGAGVVLLGVALLVVLANLFLRLGLTSQHDREREAERRRRL